MRYLWPVIPLLDLTSQTKGKEKATNELINEGIVWGDTRGTLV